MRVSRRKAKPGELCMFWGRLPHDEPDVIYAWGDGVSKRDGALLNWRIGSEYPPGPLDNGNLPSLLRELQDRGYDLSTLKFSIMKKAKP